MMEMDTRKISKFVTKLLIQTKAGHLTWENEPEAGVMEKGRDVLIRDYYVTTISTQKVGIFEEFYKVYDPDRDTFHADSIVVLALINFMGDIKYRFPPTPELHELFELVRYKGSDTESFIDSFLKGDN